MKREILFRGKANPSGEWIEGFLVGRCHIGDWVSCDPIHSKTVGQFTGLTDTNGKKIFEGDIVRSYDPDYPESQMDCGVGQVEFYAGLWYVSGEVHNSLYDLTTISCKELEVIGNIHDNPELLEGGVEECG